MDVNIFKGKTCIITGATAGIGLAMARQLAETGAQLVLAARNQQRLEEVGKACIDLGAKAIGVPTDVGKLEDCKNLIEKSVDHYGGIDCLVNNAGITMIAPFETIDDPLLFDNVMRVNFLGAAYCTYFALPYLKRSKGRIVAVSSISGFTGLPYRSAYSASKHAMVGFFDTLRLELMDEGVSVTTAYPGFVKTEIRERAFDGSGKPLKSEYVDESHSMTPEECSDIILKTAAKRKKEVIMTFRAKIGRYIKVLFPRLADRIVLRAVRTGK